MTVDPAAEPLTVAQARDHLRLPTDDPTSADEISALVTTARAHAEAHCNVVFAARTVAADCTGFEDLARPPFAPISSVTSIGYTDTAGAAQVVDPAIYELFADGLEPSICRQYGQVWPVIRPGSRITLTAVCGGNVPEPVVHAIRLMVGAWFDNREAIITGTIAAQMPLGVYDLLSNFRRGL